MTFRTLFAATIAGISFAAVAAQGEFNNQCTTGLALGKNIPTECSINLMIKGKTYCFGDEPAKSLFLEDSKTYLMKAEQFYSKGK